MKPKNVCKALACALALVAAIIFSSTNVSAAAGDLDRTFSGDGKLTDLFPGTPGGWFSATAVQPNGKIVALGNGNGVSGYLYLARYNNDSEPDTTFGGGTGKVAVDLGDYFNFFSSMALQPDGKIVVAGCYCHIEGYFLQLALARFNSDGSLDTSFGGDGVVVSGIECWPYSVAIQMDGSIVAAGIDRNNNWIISQLHSDGSLYRAFGTPGLGAPYSLAIQADGKIIAAGSNYLSFPPSDFAVVRYNTDGSLDTTFDGDGIAITPVVPGWDWASSIAIQTDGKIVVGGTANSVGTGSDFAVVRYQPNGTLDTTFDSDGILTTTIGSLSDRTSSIAIQIDGKIVLAGTSDKDVNNDFAIVRYDPNGSLDTTFGGGDGKATVDFNNSDDLATGMALDTAGRAVIVGNSDGNLAIARLLLSPNLRRNGKIAFTSDRDGNREIYVMNADGTNQTRLTDNAVVDDFPTWSPDGTKIAFASQGPAGNYSIFRMDADGTNKVEITPLQSDQFFSNISWSPDGGRLAFNDGPTIFTVNANGSGRQTLRPSSFDPAWSPDGSKILFADPDGALATIKPDGTDFQYLPGSGGNVNFPRWSPSGNKMVYVYDNMFSEQNISTADADGRNRQPFDGHFCPCQFYRFAPSYSPDGNKIVFALHSKTDNATKEIVVKNVDGTGYTQLTNAVGRNTNPSWQPLATKDIRFDFDGDGRSDISVFRPGDSTWYLNRSTSGFTSERFGLATDKVVPADFDGDGSTDISVFRDGTWWRMNSSNRVVSAIRFGIAGDLPVPGDFTGDGRDELAVYRSGVWWIYDLSNDQTSVVNFGLSNDKPVPADYDGDGRVDQAVYRNGEWHVNRSTLGYAVAQFGIPTDAPVVGDYDGDGKADFAVYRGGTWYVQQSTAGFRAFYWGVATDTPVPADYDGDGKTDAAIFRNGTWYLLRSASGVSIQQFGVAGDRPIPSAYSP